jgi:DNA-binding IclR family transcriptional regulator
LYLDHVSAENVIQIQDWTGKRTPFHVVSSGLVLLAHSSPKAIDKLLVGSLEQFTEHTTVSAKKLRQRLAAIRDAGCAWTIEEFQIGLTSVAAPVFNSKGQPVAAIHCHGPSYRFATAASRTTIETAVIAAARRSALQSLTNSSKNSSAAALPRCGLMLYGGNQHNRPMNYSASTGSRSDHVYLSSTSAVRHRR